MDAIVISIGDELLLGQRVDTNAPWLSAELAGLGVGVFEQVVVGDDLDSIVDTLERTGRKADVLLVTGGLGPTADDLTRQAVAKTVGAELELNEEALSNIVAIFERRGRKMPELNRIQAMIPQGSCAIANHTGTACGISAKIGGAVAFFMPGVPSEMKAMFAGAVREELSKHIRVRGAGRVIILRRLHTVGIPESAIAELVGDLMKRHANPLVNTTAAGGIVTINIRAEAPAEAEAMGLIKPMAGQLRQRLGRVVFGSDDESLATVVAGLLRRRGLSIAVGESCTGGLLAKELTDVPGSSEYFRCGWVVYSNEAKVSLLQVQRDVIGRSGAVSEEVARQLATNARRLAQTDYAMGITGIAGPSGAGPDKPVGLVYLALATGGGLEVRREVFGGDRAMVRRRAVNVALDMLRVHLLGGESDRQGP